MSNLSLSQTVIKCENLQMLTRCVKAGLISGSVPILIGEPGIGKSAFASALARDLGVDAIIVYLGHRDASEIHGIPVVARESVRIKDKNLTMVVQSPPDYAIEAANSAECGRGALIVFDELSCLTPEAAGAALAILHDKKVGGVDLNNERIAMLACANPAELSAGGFNLAAPLANRLAWYGFPVDRMSWTENFPSYWGHPPVIKRFNYEINDTIWAKYRSMVAAFIRTSPELLLKVPESDAARSGPWPSPRTWSNLSRDFAALEVMGVNDVDTLRYIACAHVGSGAGLDFMNWFVKQDLPDAVALLDGPESQWPDFQNYRADQTFCVISAIVAEVSRRLRSARQSMKKPEMVQAGKSWTKAINLFIKMAKVGAPRDVVTVGVGQLARNEDIITKIQVEIPDEISIFADFLRDAGLDWRRA
jgi:hypothetical protein